MVGNVSRPTLNTDFVALGLAMGWRNSTRPLFAYIPPGAVEFMKSIGLAAIASMLGLKAGPVFVDSIREIGRTKHKRSGQAFAWIASDWHARILSRADKLPSLCSSSMR